MKRTPGFTFIAVLILTLGIGATTAIFAVVQAVLLRPLPYADSERLVAFSRLYRRAGSARLLPTVSLAQVEAWRAASRSIASIGSFVFTPASCHDRWAVFFHRRRPAPLDPESSGTLGTPPALGASFSGSGSAHRDPSAIVSHAVWMDAFHGDAGIVGRTIVVDGAAYTVIGVLPASFQFPRGDASYFTDDVGLLIPGREHRGSVGPRLVAVVRDWPHHRRRHHRSGTGRDGRALGASCRRAHPGARRGDPRLVTARRDDRPRASSAHARLR